MRTTLVLLKSYAKGAKYFPRHRNTKDRSVIEKDFLRILIQSGAGGHGLSRFNGIGGCGGSVYARPTNKLEFDQLYERFQEKKELIAADGQNAKQTQLVGRHGQDQVLDVPLGVEIVGKNNMLLARCSNNRERYLLAQGGRGGCAANNFVGQHGVSFNVSINLKLRPNVGLIGYPNAGKSTLVQALVPDKHVKVASYAFTTKKPQLLYVKYDWRTEQKEAQQEQTAKEKDGAELAVEESIHSPFTLSIADLPGIVEGAAQNKYNAFDCLKHLEYSDIIVMIVDVHGFQLGPNEPHRSALETMGLLNREMELYDRTLVRKPVLLLVNKTDVDDGEEKAKALCDFLVKEGPNGKWAQRLDGELRPNYPIQFRSVHAISAKEKRLGNVKTTLKDIHRKLNPIESVTFEEDLFEKKRTDKILV